MANNVSTSWKHAEVLINDCKSCVGMYVSRLWLNWHVSSHVFKPFNNLQVLCSYSVCGGPLAFRCPDTCIIAWLSSSIFALLVVWMQEPETAINERCEGYETPALHPTTLNSFSKEDCLFIKTLPLVWITLFKRYHLVGLHFNFMAALLVA